MSVVYLLVALRKESVDRNAIRWNTCDVPTMVALRKESVDRNLSSVSDFLPALVALRKESVDRNTLHDFTLHETLSRSPQGERG